MNAQRMMSVSGMAIAAAAGLLLAGCASDGSSQLTRREGSMQNDSEYIAAVEQLARKRGTGIVWINPPDKRSKMVARDRD